MCSAGYGDNSWNASTPITQAPACIECGSTQYGDHSRTDPKCQTCPSGRVFSQSSSNPSIRDLSFFSVSKPLPTSSSQCVTEYASVTGGGFEIVIGDAGSLQDVTAGYAAYVAQYGAKTMIHYCAHACRYQSGCVALRHDYTAQTCLLLTLPLSDTLQSNPAGATTL